MAEDCTTGMGNTGYIAACSSEFKNVYGVIIQKTYADDGSENKIDANEVLDEAYLTAQINHADPSKRWYPLAAVNAFESVRAEPVYEELANGSREFIKQGTRNVSFQIRSQSSAYLGQIQACPCEELSFYFIDSKGKLRGIVKSKTSQDFYPIKMQASSLYSGLVFATDTTNEHITVQFQFQLTEDDSLLRVYNDVLVEGSLLSLKGLLDIYPVFTAVTTTGFTVKLASIYSQGNKYNASGLLIGDFSLKGNGSPIVITSVTETPAFSGTYVFVIPTTLTSVSKVLTPTKAGYDFSQVVSTPFTV